MIEFKEIKAVLLDIEGTVSDISFVKNVLFPYSRERIESYLQKNQGDNEVAQSISQTRHYLLENEKTDPNIEDIIRQLKDWIDKDVKHPALKLLQGLIWKEGFASEVFKAPLYSDVLPKMKDWKSKNIKIAIYSSGSIAAQKLFFKYTTEGDLTELIDRHFDLTTGSKKEAESYKKISKKLGIDPQKIIFFSDVVFELEACQKAGVNGVLVVRGEKVSQNTFPSISTFSEL